MTLDKTYFLLLSSLFVLAVILFMFPASAMALDVEKIGKGVVGDQREKMLVLKEIVFYFGVFFTALGTLVTLYRKKKFDLQKRNDTSNAAGPFLIVLGCIMMLIKLV